MTAQIQLLDEEYSPALSQWYTPPWLAERVVAWALEGVEAPLRILEPSAGLGALIRPIPPGHAVTAIEIDPRRIAQLSALDQVRLVRCESYVDVWRPEGFDLVLMNPPYESEADALHTRKAVLSNRRVVAILRSDALHGVERWGRLWSIAEVKRLAILVRRPSFGGSASGSPFSEFIVVELEAASHPKRLGEARPSAVEWW